MQRTAAIFLLSLCAWLCCESRAVPVELQVKDATGELCSARVHVRTSTCQSYPGYADSALMSHSTLGGYFYTPGRVAMNLPAGLTRILVGRGFEYRPVEITPDIQDTTVLVIRLDKAFDMRSRGWYSGDTHMHSQHYVGEGGWPLDPDLRPEATEDGAGDERPGTRESYVVTPEGVRRVALAEDLAQSWLLDGWYEFTGGPHALSTPDNGIYFCTEYRNQAYGHVAFLGQKRWLGETCCAAPLPAYPMLYHIWGNWLPDWDEGMSLCHPHNGAAFFDPSIWPGGGLGRELPVLAALDRLEALDLATYSNTPNVFVQDWYRLLNCGVMVPPSAGTDAMLNAYAMRPAGGYRVYVKEQPGAGHSHDRWMEGLKAGRCFVTDYPLIPRFTVDGVEMGGRVDLAEPGTVEVSFRVECVLPLSTATVIRNGATALQVNLPATQSGTEYETTFSLPVNQSCWLALRVDGTTDLRHAASTELFAHTAPVQIYLAGAAQRSQVDAGYFLDWLDSLWTWAQLRDNWTYWWQPMHVLLRINEARAGFAEAFTQPPLSFALLSPAWADTFYYNEDIAFDWDDAIDPEPGDRVCYYLEIAVEDSTFAQPHVVGPLWESYYRQVEHGLSFNLPHYWRVFAEDRAGSRIVGEPPWMWYYVSGELSDAGGEPPGHPGTAGGGAVPSLLSPWPNPTGGRVWFRCDAPPDADLRFDILDVGGGRVAGGAWGAGAGVSRGSFGQARISPIAPGVFSWDGRNSAGQRVPSGCYWLRARAAGSAGAGQPAAKPILVLR